eukprot:gene4053-7342_t
MPPFIVEEELHEKNPFPFELRQNWNEYVDELYELDRTLFEENAWAKEEIISCSKSETNQYYFTVNPIPLKNSKYPKIISYAGYEVHSCLDTFCEISVLGVSPEMQGKKIGEWTLLSLLLDAYNRGVKMAQLHVKEDNTIALNLYIKTGFKVLALKNNYYQNDKEEHCSNAYIMELRLNYLNLFKAYELSMKKITHILE